MSIESGEVHDWPPVTSAHASFRQSDARRSLAVRPVASIESRAHAQRCVESLRLPVSPHQHLFGCKPRQALRPRRETPHVLPPARASYLSSWTRAVPNKRGWAQNNAETPGATTARLTPAQARGSRRRPSRRDRAALMKRLSFALLVPLAGCPLRSRPQTRLRPIVVGTTTEQQSHTTALLQA